MGRLLASALAALVLTGTSAAAAEAATTCRLDPGDHRVAGQLVRVPAGLTGRPPLVLAFHGLGGDGAGLSRFLGLDDVARREGVVAAYPDARARDWELNRRRGDHDLPMVRRLIAALVARGCADRRRVYATGFSNGGSFAARVGCDLAGRIAAIGPVAGSYVAQDACPRTRGRMPTIEQHGTDQFLPSVARLMRMTAARNRCGRTAVSRDVGAAIRTRWRGCALERWRFPRLGHAIPSGAATRMWRFFALHHR